MIKYGPWDSSNSITWKLDRNTNSQVPPQKLQDQELWRWGPAVHVLTSPPRDSHAHLSLRTTALGNQNSIKETSKIKVWYKLRWVHSLQNTTSQNIVKRKKSNFTMKKSGIHHLNQLIKVNINNGTNWNCTSPDKKTS